MKFTQIPSDTFKQLQLNAGVLVTEFDPSTASISVSNIIGATTGGVTFTASPSFEDWGDDIDNCPKNMLELKKLTEWEVTMSGTFATMTADLAAMLVGAGDASSGKITPRNDVLTSDFADLWWVGDYSDKNGDTNGGFIAIHMLNALSTGGFQLRSSDNDKGNFAFTFTSHYSQDAPDTVPFEIYIQAGSAEPSGATGATGV